MTKKTLTFGLLILFVINTLHASEGMWLPILLKKYNIEEMQQKGFKLSAEDIYDINNASLKDAVVGFVRLSSPFHHFCSGEVISPEGLVLTNHHCGYGAIQSHSSIEHDYLTDGFWAMSKEEELANENIGVCFLRRMEDVTNEVLNKIPENATKEIRDSIINAQIEKIETEATDGNELSAKVKPFFSGNEYYLSVYEIFRDLRLVGAPPSAIGKFGGDTDNWMWPRHTGDFSMFRIYANKENKPADYSEENVPYKAKRFLEIAIDGVEKNDFTMVLGYPGTTEEYLPSFAVKLKTEVENPAKIKIRTKTLELMKSDMDADAEVRIKYAAKAAGIANGWKKWIGENKGLKRLDALTTKQELELEFTKWVNQSDDRKIEYGHVLANYEELYKKLEPHQLALNYIYETLFSTELLKFSRKLQALTDITKGANDEKNQETLNKLISNTKGFYKDYNLETDKKIFSALVTFYYTDIDKSLHPKSFQLIDKKFKGSIDAFVDYIYSKSMLPYPEKMQAFLEAYSYRKMKKFTNDPMVKLYYETINIYASSIYPPYKQYHSEINELHRIYVKGLLEFQKDKVLFPDANSTFRIAYGTIDDYEPRDGVSYFHQTYLSGIIEKDNPEIYDYRVPEKLKELFTNKDFGSYGTDKKTMPVCFTASNHTTGGNSGSPILNENGQLIGINFDRNWEGTMSDVMYDPDMCRNITLDIRYVLFIVDKFAGAKHLVDEMTLVNAKQKRQLP
ncbi:MAG: S46 family peptidase [Salinivirgaceae bacterium]|nr:S46 family peptidase [Salinivirgaceae bacterium]